MSNYNMKQWVADLIGNHPKKPMPILSFPCVQLMGINVGQLVVNSEYQGNGMAEIAVPRKSACGHDCEECAGEGAGHSHGEERCCDDTQLYLRVQGADVHFEKKYISFNNGFILPEQIVLPVEDSRVPYISLWHLKIPDVWVPNTGLRAPPVA